MRFPFRLNSSNLIAHLRASLCIRNGFPFGRYLIGKDHLIRHTLTDCHDVMPKTSLQYATISSRPLACPVDFVIVLLSPPGFPISLLVFTFDRALMIYAQILLLCQQYFDRLRGSWVNFYPLPYATPSKAQDSRSNPKSYLPRRPGLWQSATACRQSE